MALLTADPSGLVLACPACAQANRLPYRHWTSATRCGRCRAELVRPPAVVEAPDAAAFRGLVASVPCPVLVDFWAPWCGPCRSMAPEFERLAAGIGQEAILVKLNTEEVPEVASEHRIQSIPAFVLFLGGREIARTAGAMPASRLREFIRQSIP
jgi:thioredoxin 2